MRLRLMVGNRYVLYVRGREVVTFTQSSPEHDVPMDLVARARLLEEMVPVLNSKGQVASTVQRFKAVTASSERADEDAPRVLRR